MLKIFLPCLMWISLTGHLPGSRLGTDRFDCPSFFHKELNTQVYSSGEKAPEFAGGAVAYMRFINKNLRVPFAIIDQEYIPTVKMEFIVDLKGKLNCITINGKKDTAAFEALEKEVYRLLKIMPEWEPGSCKGKKVPMLVKRPLIVCISVEND